MGKQFSNHEQGTATDLDWYGNIIVVKSDEDGKIVDLEEDDITKAVEDVTM